MASPRTLHCFPHLCICSLCETSQVVSRHPQHTYCNSGWCVCVCWTPFVCMLSPVGADRLADRAEQREKPVSSEPGDSLWRHLLWSPKYVAVCLGCCWCSCTLYKFKFSFTLFNLGCLSAVCAPHERLTAVSLVLARFVRHQSAQWLGARGCLPPCHWLASANREGSNQSPAASCGSCVSVFFLVEWGTAKPQTALSAEKEAITSKSQDLLWGACRVAG